MACRKILRKPRLEPTLNGILPPQMDTDVHGVDRRKERVDAPSQVYPFTKAQRDAMPDRQPAFI
jgi:hypothetical protein